MQYSKKELKVEEKVMKFMKKSCSKVVFFLNLFMTLQSIQGFFWYDLTEKSVKISVQTSHFLKNIIILQQNFLKHQLETSSCDAMIQSMIAFNRTVLQNLEITKNNMKNLFDIMHEAQKNMMAQKIVISSIKLDSAWHAWYRYLDHSLTLAQLRGYQKDVEWLRSQIIDGKTMSSVITCLDLMHHFNGLLVTDYDLLVLGNLVVALAAKQG